MESYDNENPQVQDGSVPEQPAEPVKKKRIWVPVLIGAAALAVLAAAALVFAAFKISSVSPSIKPSATRYSMPHPIPARPFSKSGGVETTKLSTTLSSNSSAICSYSVLEKNRAAW